MKVLIADNNEVHQLAASSIFQDLGINVERTNNCKKAQQLVMNKYFDLMFIDLDLTDNDPIQIVSEIRHVNQYYLMKIPIIAISASTAMAGAELGMLGFNAFLPKPFNYSDLEKMCKKYWAHRSFERMNGVVSESKDKEEYLKSVH